MSLSQLRLVNAAYKHGACKAGASSMHGWARFHSDDNAAKFAELMLTQQWSVTRYKQERITDVVSCVDWTAPRMANGYVTPMRSECKS